MVLQPSTKKELLLRRSGENIWLGLPQTRSVDAVPQGAYEFAVLESEADVGQAMFDELTTYSREKAGDITTVLLGGRGAQAMYRLISEQAKTEVIDDLLARLNVFTQDALAPMNMANGFSFVRDFERLLGPEFFAKVKSFTPMNTETDDLEGELAKYVEQLEYCGGIDLFFLGMGPEADDASHLCYIKPGCGAQFNDFAGVIPISSSILEHHISKFKAGGSEISLEDEVECRNATSILTLGPAAILGARRIVQSIVDASTAPAKPACFRRLIDTELSSNESELQSQADTNPGLLVRMHPDVRTYVLPDLIK